MSFYNVGGGGGDPFGAAGITVFVQDAKPTANATNDRWYSKDGFVSAFWNGTYWLGNPGILSHEPQNAFSVAGGRFGTSAPTTNNIFVEKAAISTIVSGVNNGNTATDYWTIELSVEAVQNTSRVTVASFDTSADTQNVRTQQQELNINTVVDSTSGGGGLVLRLDYAEVGNPGNLTLAAALRYYEIL